MEKYRCCNCGKIFPCEEAEGRREYIGEFWGMPAYDTIDICPDCFSDDLEYLDDDEEEEE